MKLVKLIKNLSVIKNNINEMIDDIEVSSIHYSSQYVKPGGVFIAIKGLKSDGHNYIEHAIKNGAVAIISEKSIKSDCIIIQVKDSREALSEISEEFYGKPSQDLFIIGITGTNGKTTVTYILENILTEAGYKVGVIGTINCRYDGKIMKSPVTTPESMDLQKILADMKQNGVTHVVMEISSHAIDLKRIHNCFIDVGIFTNLSQDHLDYHKTMEAYWQSKKRLFTEQMGKGCKKNKACTVINMNDSKGTELQNSLTMPVITVGTLNNCMINTSDITFDQSGTKGKIIINKESFIFQSKLVGKHNLENILCAVGAADSMGLSKDIIKKGIESFAIVPGRLEPINNSKGRFIYVDYAHTPDALENVLKTLKGISPKKIICVFGCGGDRDSKKRPLMGKIAGELSDFAIITSDNPRTEDPLNIILNIEDGIKSVMTKKYNENDISMELSEKGYIIESDRKKAIYLAVKIAKSGDTILIAGKGHENYQILGNNTIDFDDRIYAKEAINQ
ncbi:MAG: UDP-N-acetylmuramoyl-L-alanyl-D-glutamate--2,6-diaminopimelate ligase [Desulfobacterales bacterium]|nr:UDP-N-acetylmuramoyl-L-alanyl-D-glutamate--2,6-diaminopimelate ligase [Desulfobacterales bacterium]